jgi:nucleoside-diphosphate-sugar epimerase
VRQRQIPIVGKGRAVTSYVHLHDAASATVAALERGRGIYNVVDDDPAPMREWLPVYAKAIGAKAPRRVPAWLARVAAGAMVTRSATEMRGASNARAKAELGWEPALPSWREGFATALNGAPAGTEARA